MMLSIITYFILGILVIKAIRIYQTKIEHLNINPSSTCKRLSNSDNNFKNMPWSQNKKQDFSNTMIGFIDNYLKLSVA